MTDWRFGGGGDRGDGGYGVDAGDGALGYFLNTCLSRSTTS